MKGSEPIGEYTSPPIGEYTSALIGEYTSLPHHGFLLQVPGDLPRSVCRTEWTKPWL